MCRLVAEAARQGGKLAAQPPPSLPEMLLLDQQVISDARRITGEPEGSEYIPIDPRELSNRIFHTCYMGTENSSPETRKRAKDLAEAIGRCAYFYPSIIMSGEAEYTPAFRD